MPKLKPSRGGENPARRKTAQVQQSVLTIPPCSRCLVALAFESTWTARGLTGRASTQKSYVCPACDARFVHSSETGRWKELD
jgi:hypothetical protein